LPEADADGCIPLQNDRGVPSWVDDSGTNTGTGIATREGSATRTYSVFRKRINAGTVTLGPWNSVTSMYMVIIR
jgi:hypothetical protein